MEKDNKVTFVTIILALICLAILGYIVYFKTIKNKEKTNEPIVEDKTAPENTEKPEEPAVNEDENADEELIDRLYLMIENNPEFRYEATVTFETLSESVRDGIVVNYLSTECEELATYEKDYFLSTYKEIFNHEKASEEGLCKLNGENYECTRYCTEFNQKVLSVYEKYEKADDTVVIYEKIGHLDYSDDGKIYLKETTDGLSIASFDSLDELNDAETKYKLPTYKHTFIKNGDTYYWSKSELVKQ